jgi:hypothetical protein
MSCIKAPAALLLCLAISTLQGCIILPVPHGRPSEVSAKAFDWAVPGSTTRRDFILKLGDPLVSQRDDTIFVYAADTVAFIWLIGGGYSAAGGGINKTYFVLVRFDARGVLEELKLADGFKEDPCVATGFCDPLPPMHPGSS